MRLLQITLCIVGLLFAGCSGDSGSSSSGTITGAAAVSLTGVVVSGTTAGGVAVGALQPGTLAKVNGALGNAIVIAVDSSGNAQTTTADRSGSFALDVQTGTAYGVVFMDGKTLKVIGSLVQAANTGAASALNMTGDADLGQVVLIQPQVKLYQSMM